MGWIQTRVFHPSIGGNRPGYCLQNVRKGYDIAAKYANATAAWNGTKQHRNRNVPLGVAVPLFYTFWTKNGNEGHINVRLPDGRVWSDGDYYASIADYEAKKAPDFIGWGESVNGVGVIAEVADPPPQKMPPINSRVQFTTPRTAFVAGTTTVKGVLPPDIRYVRGYDPKYPYRILVNSASVGNGVAVALYYTNGKLIEGWKVV